MQQKSRDSPASFLLDYKVVFFFQLWFSFAFPYCKTWRILAVWTCAKNVGVPHVLDHDAHSKGNIFRIFPFTPPNEGTDTALCCSVRNGVRNIIVKQGRYFAVFQHFRISFNFFFPLIQRFKISFFCIFQPLFCGLKIFSDGIWLGDLILKVSPLLLHAKIWCPCGILHLYPQYLHYLPHIPSC